MKMKKLLIIVVVIMLMPISVIAEEGPKPYGMQFPEWQQGSLKGLKWGMLRKDCAAVLKDNGLWFDSTTKDSVQRPNMARGYVRATHAVNIGGRGTFGNVNVASTTVHPTWMFFIDDRLVKIELVSLRVNDDLYKQSKVMFGDGMEQSSDVGHHWRTGKTKNFPFEKEYTCTRFFTYTMIENELKYVWDTKQQTPLRIDVIRLCSWSIMDLYYERGAYERQYFRFQDYLRKRDTERHIKGTKVKYITEEELDKGSKANEVKELEAKSKLVFE